MKGFYKLIDHYTMYSVIGDMIKIKKKKLFWSSIDLQSKAEWEEEKPTRPCFIG